MSTRRRSSSRRRSTRIDSSDQANGAGVTPRRSSSTRRSHPHSHSRSHSKKSRHLEGEFASSNKKPSRRSAKAHNNNNNDTEQSPTSSPSNDDVTTASARRRVTRSSSAKKRNQNQGERHDDEVDYLTTPKKKSNTQQDGEDWTVSPSLLYRTNAALDAVKQSCTRYQLLAFDHCPAWLKDNRYIRSGYRANIGWRQSVESVCHLHNETVNVWSHLIAFLVMTCLLFATMMILSPHGVDRLDLDVVLSSRPICDGPERNPRCDLQGALSNALPNSADPNSSAAAAGSSSEEPLELLHQILGDDQDEMLIELLSRVQTHVPNLQHLTQTLKEKASSIQASIYAAVPEDASRQLKQLKDETSLTFSEYVHQMDDKLTELKLSISKLMSESVEEKAAVATQRVQEEYGKLKETLSELSKAFSTDFTSPRNLDVIRSTEQFLATFFDQTHFRDGFNLSPTLIAMPNVKVKVKSVTAAGMPLGTGSIFGKGLEDALDDLSPSRAGHSTELDLLAATQQSHETKLDADGNGMTTSTSIGYMGIEAHTSKSQPGLVRLQLHSYLPRYPLAIFLVTAMLCLFFSSVYHLMHAVSDVWARRFQALDYAGIVLLIAGSTHPVIYYGFFCSPLLKWSYIGVVWTLALIVFTIVVLPAYREMKYRGLKVFCFICLGFSGCVPLMHLNLLLGEIHFIFYWLCVMGFCYLTGAAIYLFQVPERWWPGHFDYFFSSHQLWHVSIFAAVLVHYFGLMHHFEWRMTRVCTPEMWS